MTDSNGTTENKGTPNAAATKKPSKVQELIKAQKASGTKVAGKAAKDLLEAFKKGLADRDKAEAALEAANKAMAENSEAMVMAFGDKKVAVGNRTFFPASRGDTVFYRELSKIDEESIVRA